MKLTDGFASERKHQCWSVTLKKVAFVLFLDSGGLVGWLVNCLFLIVVVLVFFYCLGDGMKWTSGLLYSAMPCEKDELTALYMNMYTEKLHSIKTIQ